MTAAIPTVGQIIAGRYEVRNALGSRAFGEVHEVFDHNLKQACALKIHNRMVAGPWTEAQTLRQLDGEYILKVLNADLAEGAPYVVTHLATNGTPSPTRSSPTSGPRSPQLSAGLGRHVRASPVSTIRSCCTAISNLRTLSSTVVRTF
jgi:serine/threonine protein kinase